jgi:hypothetical protein
MNLTLKPETAKLVKDRVVPLSGYSLAQPAVRARGGAGERVLARRLISFIQSDVRSRLGEAAELPGGEEWRRAAGGKDLIRGAYLG